MRLRSLRTVQRSSTPPMRRCQRPNSPHRIRQRQWKRHQPILHRRVRCNAAMSPGRQATVEALRGMAVKARTGRETVHAPSAQAVACNHHPGKESLRDLAHCRWALGILNCSAKVPLPRQRAGRFLAGGRRMACQRYKRGKTFLQRACELRLVLVLPTLGSVGQLALDLHTLTHRTLGVVALFGVAAVAAAVARAPSAVALLAAASSAEERASALPSASVPHGHHRSRAVRLACS